MIFFKRTLPILVCFVVGIIFIVQFYVPNHASQEGLRFATNWVKIVTGFSYLIGLQSLLHLHWTRIRRQRPGWGYSLLMYLGFLPMVAFGLSGELAKFLEITLHIPHNWAWSFQEYTGEGGTGTIYDWMFQNLYTPANSTMFSLLAFFIASAAYRTFRAKTVESALLLVAALFVIFGRVPLAATISNAFPAIADWIMAYPNLAVKRAIFIGVSLGMVGTALRVIFGIERAYIGGD
jgi:hypothetical protein